MPGRGFEQVEREEKAEAEPEFEEGKRPAHPAARNQESAKACCGGGGGWNKDVQGGTAPSTGGSWLEFCVAKINK